MKQVFRGWMLLSDCWLTLTARYALVADVDPSVVHPVLISRQLWNTVRKLAPLILLPHLYPPTDAPWGGAGRLPHSRESTVDLSPPVWERLTHPQHQYSKQFVWFVMASGLTFHRSRDILITRCFKFRRVGCRWFSITCWLCCCWPGKPQQLGRRHSERAAGTGHNERAASTAVYPRWHRVRHRSD